MANKICKYCRSEIDRKASVCPHCQRKQSGLDGAGKAIFAVIALIVVLPLGASACRGFSQGYNNAKNNATVEVLTTAEKSVSIQTGTTDSADNMTVTETKAEQVTENTTEAETSEPVNQVVYDDNGVKITYTGIEEKSSRYEVMFLIENNNDYNCCVQDRNLSVNGYMISGGISATIAPQKKINDGLSIYKRRLEENKIDNIDNIEFNFCIYDWDSMAVVANSDVISININE